MDEQQTTPSWKYPQTYDASDKPISEPEQPEKKEFDSRTILKHLVLFVLTFICVTFVGASFVGFSPSFFPLIMPETGDIWRGVLFASLLLGFLGVHEFGHFFAAQYHKIKVTLPYFIPIPIGIGTMGAVIRIKQKINDTRKLFDVGVAGPLAGFVVSLAVLIAGFATLPAPEYINNFTGHDAVQEYVNANGAFPADPPEATEGNILIVGETLLYSFLAQFFENVPPMWEMYHYPFLFAGWLGLFFTALNLMPVGQLDGGHILYSLIGFKKHRIVARITFAGLTVLAGIEAIPFIFLTLGEWGWAHPVGLYSWFIWGAILFVLFKRAFRGDHQWIAPALAISMLCSALYLYLIAGSLTTTGSLIWVVWSFFIAYFVGVEHPPAYYERPLGKTRKILGWLSMIIFLLCISPNPLYFV